MLTVASSGSPAKPASQPDGCVRSLLRRSICTGLSADILVHTITRLNIQTCTVLVTLLGPRGVHRAQKHGGLCADGAVHGTQHTHVVAGQHGGGRVDVAAVKSGVERGGEVWVDVVGGDVDVVEAVVVCRLADERI